MDDDTPLGRPIIREWELNSTEHDRYEAILAAPSDSRLVTMWTVWAVCFAIFSLFSFTVWLAIVLSKQVRNSPFNFYLIFLMIPEWSYTFFYSITCALNWYAGHFWSARMCRWQSFYLTWGISCNAWLSAVVCWEILRLLRSSRIQKHYEPPTKKQIRLYALAVNLFCMFLASWGVFEFPWLPHRTNVHSGIACAPLEFNSSSTLFFWLCFMPLFVVIPSFYIAYVIFIILRRNLLPPKGRRRVLSIYFFRLVAVFYLWVPCMVVFFALGKVSSWAVFFSATFAHTQAAVMAALALLKPDIRLAVKQLLTCDCVALRACERPDSKSSLETRSTTRWSSIRSLRSTMRQSTSTRQNSMRQSSMRQFDEMPRQCSGNFQFDDEQSSEDDGVVDNSVEEKMEEGRPVVSLENIQQESAKSLFLTEEEYYVDSKDESELPVAPF